MSSDFCIRCDDALSVYCGKCMDGVRDELERLRRLVPNGTYTLNVAHEEEIQRLRSLADSAAHEQGIAQLRMMQAQKSRGEARAELAFIESEYAAANESDLTRDALCLQVASLRALIREAHRELSTIEAITVSPSDTDGLIQLCKRLADAGGRP